MKRRTIWLFLVFVVTAINTWAAYVTAIYCGSMVGYDPIIVAGLVGVVTLMLAVIIVSS